MCDITLSARTRRDVEEFRDMTRRRANLSAIARLAINPSSGLQRILQVATYDLPPHQYDRQLLAIRALNVDAQCAAGHRTAAILRSSGFHFHHPPRTTRHRDGVERCGWAAGRAGPAHRQEARPQTGRHAATPHRPNPPPRLPRRVGGEAARGLDIKLQRRLFRLPRRTSSTEGHCYLQLRRYPAARTKTCIDTDADFQDIPKLDIH